MDVECLIWFSCNSSSLSMYFLAFQELGYVNWDLISRVDRLPRGNSSGDWLDALIVAMDMLKEPQYV